MGDNYSDDDGERFAEDYENADFADEDSVNDDEPTEEGDTGKKEVDDEDDDGGGGEVGVIINNSMSMEICNKPANVVKSEKRISRQIISEFEFCDLMATRIEQLNQGYPTLHTGISNENIAVIEISNKEIPFVIERKMPDNNIERWKLNELLIPQRIVNKYRPKQR